MFYFFAVTKKKYVPQFRHEDVALCFNFKVKGGVDPNVSALIGNFGCSRGLFRFTNVFPLCFQHTPRFEVK